MGFRSFPSLPLSSCCCLRVAATRGGRKGTRELSTVECPASWAFTNSAISVVAVEGDCWIVYGGLWGKAGVAMPAARPFDGSSGGGQVVPVQVGPQHLAPGYKGGRTSALGICGTCLAIPERDASRSSRRRVTHDAIAAGLATAAPVAKPAWPQIR